MEKVSEHVKACSDIFWPLEGAFDKLELKGALKKEAHVEAMAKFASGTDKASALLCCSFTPSGPQGQVDEEGKEIEQTKCKASISCEFAYSRAASYILLLKKNPAAALDERVPMAKQVHVASFDGGAHGAEMSPYDSMFTYMDAIFQPYVAAYLQVEVEADGGALSKAQTSVKDAMKRMEQSLATVRDQYTFATVKLNVHPSIGDFYEANAGAGEDAGLEHIDTGDKDYIKELEASVAGWSQEITRVIREDRDASEGSALRDIEFFTEMIGALQKLKDELERPAIKCTEKALTQGGSRFALGQLRSTEKSKDEKLKLAEAALKLLQDLPVTQLKSITNIDEFGPLVTTIFSSKAQPLGLMEKVKRVFVPTPLWTRLDDLLIALTRDFVSQLKEVLVAEKPLHMEHLEMKTIMESAKEALKKWDDEYLPMYTHLDEVWKREDIQPRAGFKVSRDRVVATTRTFRTRITEVTQFREDHVQLQKAIERVMGRASSISGSKDVLQKLEEQFQVMQDVDWLAELGDVRDAEDDEEEAGETEWSKAVDRYDAHVAKVEDVLNGELKKLLDEAGDADAMFRVFKKVNALFVRPAIRENIKAYQKPLVDSVKDSIRSLEDQFTMQYHKSQACVMSRARDMTDMSGAIVWGRQLQRQLGVYQKQVAEILGTGSSKHELEKDELGRDLLQTCGTFEKKLKKALDDSVKSWLQGAGDLRSQSISSQTVFEIKQASGKYRVEVNFDPKAAELLKDYRLLQGIGLLDPSKPGAVQAMMQINWLKERYPSYRALSDTLKTYERTVERITPDVSSLTAEARAEAQECITQGVLRKKWTLPITADQYSRELGGVVAKFESTVDDLLDKYRVLNEKLNELDSCPATQGHISKALEEIQQVVNQMDLDENANGAVWMDSFRGKVDAVLLGRMRKMITMWAKNIDRLGSGGPDEGEGTKVCGVKQVRSVHRIRIQRGAIVLDPPVAMARHHWLGQLQACLQIVAKQTKLTVSSYGSALDASAAKVDTTMSYLLEKLKPEFMGAQQTIEREVGKAQAAADMWMRYKSLWAGNSNDVLTYMSEEHQDDLGKWISMLVSMRTSRSELDLGDKGDDCAITVDYSEVQTRVMEKYDVWIKDLLMKFAETMMAATDSWFQGVNDAREKLEKYSMDTGDTMQAIEFLTAVESFKEDKIKWGETVANFRKGEKHLLRERMKLPENWIHADGIENEWNSFLQIFDKKEKQVAKAKPDLQLKITTQDDAIEAKVKKLKAEWEGDDLSSKETIEGGHKEMLAKISAVQASIDEIDENYTMIGQAKVILGIETVGGTNKLESIKDDCRGLTEVWTEIQKIHDGDGGLEELNEQSWRSVDPKKVLKALKELREKMKDMPSRLRSFPAHAACLGAVDHRIAQNQLLTGLTSQSLKDRHWDVLRKKMDLGSMDLLTLGDMYAKDMLKYKAVIEKLQVQAQGEMALEEFIKSTQEKWNEKELELVNYQNKIRLIRGWDDLFTDLGENIASLQSMRLSPYFKPFAKDTGFWEDKLNSINERMNIWVDVQRRWVYLETIFLGSQEIKYQLPQEHKRFMSIDHSFKGLHKAVAANPKVLDVEEIEELLDRLTNLQDQLKNIQKALGDYLEKQRQQFARFYFVGDEDLLELIGSSKDPAKVQKHFSKMFAGISALVIDEEEKGSETQVIVSGMISHAGLETVPFNNPINVTENPKINVWLTMLEVEMRNALAAAAENALAELRAMAEKDSFANQKEDFLDWLAKFPSQCGLLMCQVQWTEATEKALLTCESGDTSELVKVGESIESTLSCLAGQVLVEKSLLQRKKAEAMITELVHQRTVTRDLLEAAKTHKISSTAFQWLYYMRFYWVSSEKKVEERCKIKMSDATFSYGYEYQGVVERLVQTPLSDRAYLTLTQALHYRLGGSPYGPAGTGKTETVKALGCQLGRYVLVFCCDENFDMHAMGRIFIGLCQVGAWGCFDEFNRLEERMLSAVSQQIQVIQEGLMTNGDKIDLLGRNFVPHTDMGIFVTMNPGYAGRSELPDNLKQLLRACAMTAPDRELIAEVMLYAQGFNNAEPLSCKIVPLFNLCRDQLSAQPHYDFGLRALKSVLNSAGNIKRAMLASAAGDESVDTQGLVPEQELIIRSISETVAPKLVGGDLPLLKTLITDVFPGIRQDPREFDALMTAITNEVKSRNLEMGEVWLSKIIQLYQIQELHHGFMVVGPTGTGKTMAWEILLEAMGAVPGGRKGKGWVIDPKAMPKDDLYGYMDNTTREWTDGVFTQILRKIIDDTKTLQQSGLDDQIMTHWIVFDGDVDPVWVENLNSVLDDNKLLTLPNGERLSLLPNIRIVFEVQDLKYATAATVSRCGMVWFSDNTVPVQDAMKHYLADLRTKNLDVKLPAKGGGEGEGMMDKKKALEVQSKCADAIEAQIIGDASLLQTALEEAAQIFTIMDFVPLQSMNAYFDLMNVGVQNVLDYNGSHEDFPLADDVLTKFIRRHSLRSIAWACAGSMKMDDRLQFGRDLIKWSTETMDGLDSDISLIELYCNVNNGGEWEKWDDQVPEQSIKADQVGRSDVVITTSDTLRHVDTLTAWLVQRKPLILCGPPGSGKSMTMMSTLRQHPNLDCVALNFSSSTDPELIMTVMDQYCVCESAPGGKGMIMKPKQPDKWVVMFCDECNLPAADDYGTQMVISFIRGLVEKGGFWRPKDGQWIKLERIQFLGACNPPTDPGREPLTHRFLRFAPLLLVDYPAAPSLKLIYGIFNRALLDPTPVADLADAATEAMVETYEASRLKFTPDAQPHYIYSPRELTRWTRALREGLVGQEAISEVELVRLIMHEGLRLFRDRLTTPEEEQWADEKMDSIFKTAFPSVDCDTALQRPILYCSWLTKNYVDTDQDELREYVQSRLKTFAEEELDVKLVVFDGVLDHVLRIDRVLKQPSGHALLAGASGAGKTVLSRFTAWMNGLSIFQIKIHKKYGLEEFDEDLRLIMKRSGVEQEKIAFIIDESNVISTAFMEKMNALLASGEVPGLFEGEELNQLLNGLRERHGSDTPPDELFELFTKDVCRNLHIIFTMNPANAGFSNRTATSPALFNRCVVDWFGDWNHQALEQVAAELTDQMGELTTTDDVDPMDTKATVVNTMVFFHERLKEISEDLLQAHGRTNHMTPRHYTDFILHYTNLYASKREELNEQQVHLNKGLKKLEDTETDVQQMQQSLAVKNAELAQAGKDAEEKLSAMLVDQKEAEEKKSSSETLSVDVKKQQGLIAERQKEAEEELATVEPAIAEAKQAVGGIKKSHLDEIRNLGKPPPAIELTMNATLILLGKGKKPWAEIRKIMRDKDFIPNMLNFDSEKISAKMRTVLEKDYVNDPNFQYEKVQKASRAAGPLCKWCRAQLQYSAVLAKAEPLRKEVAKLIEDGKETKDQYDALVAAADEAEKRVTVLKQEYSVLIGHKTQLEAELVEVKDKAERAVNLLQSLGSERDRWREQQSGFQTQMATVPGDTLVAAAFLAYLGYFNEEQRAMMMVDIKEHMQEAQPPVAIKENLSLSEYLSTADDRLVWGRNGLPADNLCTENAVMVERFNRYPLMIDPSGQAVEFLLKQKAEFKIQKTSFLDEAFTKVLESAVRFGTAVLVQDVETLDPILNPILNREVTKNGPRTLIRIGENEVDYSPAFQIFLSTRNPIANFAPDICSRVTFVNFTITKSSLQSQCLSELLKKERPDIQKLQEEQLKLQGEFQAKLLGLEEDLLNTLNAAEGNLLEDTTVITKMQTIKKESTEVAQKMEATKEVQAKIDEVNDFYRVFAVCLSDLYFLLEGMGDLHFLYQFSLGYFLSLFDIVLNDNKNLEDKTDASERLAIMMDDIFKLVYRRVIRGLLDSDQIVLAFRLGQIRLEARGASLDDNEFSCFLKGALQPKQDATIPSGLLNDEQETRLKEILSLGGFSKLEDSMCAHEGKWKEFVEAGEPEKMLVADGPIPDWEGPGADSPYAVSLRRMLILKALRPDRLLLAMDLWVEDVLGAGFLTMPSVGEELITVVKSGVDAAQRSESGPKEPLLLVNRPGHDASYRVDNLARELNPSGGLVSIAMGSPEGYDDALKEVTVAAKRGSWVMLKNVHLATTWLEQLEKLLHATAAHDNFRLFLTTEFNDKIPSNLIRSSQVFIFEPPSGVIASLRQTMAMISPDRMQKRPTERGKLHFMLAWFHAVTVDRLRFSPLGWSNYYEFSSADMRCAFDCFDAWIDAKGGGKHNIDPEEIPWSALVTSLGQVFYGGRVDNLFDQRVMMSFLKQIFKPEAFKRDFNLADSPEKLPFLTLPDSHDRKDFLQFIDELATHSENPEWLGLPSSAELVIRADAGRDASLRLAKLQDDGDGGGSGGGKSRSEIAAEMTKFADLILGQLPESIAAIAEDGSAHDKTALERFFERELSLAISMVKMIRKDLGDLKTVASGEARSTDRTRAIQASLLKGEVPPIWLKYPIPEITVNAWVADFVARSKQLVEVSAQVIAASKDGIAGMSTPVWMGGFFMSGAFLTATQQTAAKVLNSSMEQLQMIVDVVEDEANPFDEAAPAGSQYLITGVFLEAATWDNGALALTNQMLNRMPTVKITWLVQGSQDLSDRVELPVYLNVTRKQLVTTALIKGPSAVTSGTWYQRGTSVQLWRQV